MLPLENSENSTTDFHQGSGETVRFLALIVHKSVIILIIDSEQVLKIQVSINFSPPLHVLILILIYKVVRVFLLEMIHDL